MEASAGVRDGRGPAIVVAILTGGALLLLVLAWLAVALLDPLVGRAVGEADEALLAWVGARFGRRLDVPAVEVTYLGSTLVVAAILAVAAVLLWAHRLKVAVLFLTAAVAGTSLLSAVLKELVGRTRPDLPGPLPHIFEASFPSGHAIRSVALFGGIAWLVWRLDLPPGLRAATAAVAGLTILLVGASRIYLGVHFPSDVVAGYLLGAAWLAICGLAARQAGGLTRRSAVTRRHEGGMRPPDEESRPVAGSGRGREP